MNRRIGSVLLILAVFLCTACETGQLTTEKAQTVPTEIAQATEKPATQDTESTEPETEAASTEDGFEYDGSIQIHREEGTLQTLFNYEPGREYTIHYPSFGKDAIDRAVLKRIEAWREDFVDRQKQDQAPNEKQARLHIEYSSYRTGDLVTVLFRLFETDAWMAHPDVQWRTAYYDLKADKERSLEEILPTEALEKIAAQADTFFRTDPEWKNRSRLDEYEDHIKPTYENYPNLLIKKDGVRILFDKYQLYAGSDGAPVVELKGEEWTGLASLPEDPVTETAQITTETTEEATEEPAAEETPDTTEEPDEPETPETAEPTETAETPATTTGSPAIALTYDDGPTESNTYRILDALRNAGGHATFYMVGNRVESYPEVVLAVVNQGSEIGNHSYSHADLTTLGIADLTAQFTLTDQAIQNVAGVTPQTARPPYGAYDSDVIGAANRPLVQWSLDTVDWKTRDAQATIDAVLSSVQDGDIILMHDLHEATAAASETFIPALVERGYRLLTVSELMEERGASDSVLFSIR